MSNRNIQRSLSSSNHGGNGQGATLDLSLSGSTHAKQPRPRILRTKSAESSAIGTQVNMRMGLERSFSMRDIKPKKPGRSLDTLLDSDGKERRNRGDSATVCGSINIHPQKNDLLKAEPAPKLPPPRREMHIEKDVKETLPPRRSMLRATSIRDLANARREMLASSKGDDASNSNQSSLSLLGHQRDPNDPHCRRTVHKTRKQDIRNGSKHNLETKVPERKPLQRSKSEDTGLRKSAHGRVQQTSLLNDVSSMESKSDLFDAGFDSAIFAGLEPAHENKNCRKGTKDVKSKSEHEVKICSSESKRCDSIRRKKSKSSEMTTTHEKGEQDGSNSNFFYNLDLDAAVDESALMTSVVTSVRSMEQIKRKHRKTPSRSNSDSQVRSKTNRKHHSKREKNEEKHRRPPPPRRSKSEETSKNNNLSRRSRSKMEKHGIEKKDHTPKKPLRGESKCGLKSVESSGSNSSIPVLQHTDSDSESKSSVEDQMANDITALKAHLSGKVGGMLYVSRKKILGFLSRKDDEVIMKDKL